MIVEVSQKYNQNHSLNPPDLLNSSLSSPEEGPTFHETQNIYPQFPALPRGGGGQKINNTYFFRLLLQYLIQYQGD